MEIKKFQEMCADIVEDIDKKYKLERDPQLSLVQFFEEAGELAKEINKPRLRGKEIDRENLNGEIADVILQLAILARMLNIDFEEAVQRKMVILKERHSL